MFCGSMKQKFNTLQKYATISLEPKCIAHQDQNLQSVKVGGEGVMVWGWSQGLDIIQSLI